jgi:hypothetical protein
MIRIPKFKVTLLCAGIALFGQSLDAGALRSMADVFKRAMKDLVGSYYTGRAHTYERKARSHRRNSSYAKENFRDHLGDRCVITGLKVAGVGLVGAGLMKQNVVDPQSVAYGAAAGGAGVAYTGALIARPVPTLFISSLALSSIYLGRTYFKRNASQNVEGTSQK